MAERTKHPVDLALYNNPKFAGRMYRDPDVDGFGLPMDLPMFAKVYRLMKDTPDHNQKKKVHSRALVGHTLEICDPTYGVTIYIRRGMGDDQTLKVFIEDADGREVVAEYSKE